MHIRQIGAYPIHQNGQPLRKIGTQAAMNPQQQAPLSKPGSYEQLFTALEKITYSQHLSEYEQVQRYAEQETIKSMYQFVDVYV